MSFRTAVMAAAAMFATVNAHVKMTNPVPFSVDTLDTAPVNQNDYPCKRSHGYKVSKVNEMKVGEKNTLALDGSAVHGGGSCQLSVTLDTEPTANSVFKVIMSMEGGCPGVEAKALSYDFTLPDSIPNGNATFAWTWMSKLAGQSELYMNCAPISVTGGASDKTKFEALPDMLKINVDSSCKSVPNAAVAFPNPGQNVLKGATNDAKPPLGDGCGSSGSAPADPPAGGAPSAGQPSAAPSPPAGGAPSTGQPSAAPSPPAGGAPSPTVSSPAAGQPSAAPTKPAGGKPSPPPSNPGGGVFAPGASSGPALPTSTTLITVTATPTAPTGAGPTAPAGVSPPSPIGTGTPSTPSTPSSPSAGGGSGTCTTNGAVVCNGATQFGLCNNGNVVWQAVAAGTTCVNGSITKRAYYGRVARPRRSSRRVVPN